MPPRQPSKPLLALTITFLVLLLCAFSWKLWLDHTGRLRQITAPVLKSPFNSSYIQAPDLAPETNAISLIATNYRPSLTYTRPWLHFPDQRKSLFDFTDSEWSLLTNVFPTRLISGDTLTFAENDVIRVTTESLRATTSPHYIQTNAVWFLAPTP